MTRRRQKGDVHIWRRKGRLALRWTYQGRKYSLALGLPDTPINRKAAKSKAADIAGDIARDQFDPSLKRYRGKEEIIPPSPPSTLELWQQFTQHRFATGTSGQRIAAIYTPLLSNLKRFGEAIDSEASARRLIDLLRSRQSARTANQNLSLLKGFGAWAVKAGYWETNHFLEIPKLKDAGEPVQNREPFSRQEIQRLLQTLKTDDVHYYYYDFTYTMLSLGIRPSECIGLRWRDVDLERGLITIHQSLSRGPDGRTSGTARERKTTKTKTKTVLKLTPKLMALLKGRKNWEAKPNDLIFTSKRGKPIDDHTFSQRVWKPLCRKAGVDHRPPYASRHTLISHGIEEKGWSLPQAARIAGHRSTRMISETYGKAIDLPDMPEF